jgi:hypothetical protein
MVVYTPTTVRPTYLYRARRAFLVTRANGDIVRLAWKQVAVMLFGAILPAISFGGALWYWAERVVIIEQTTAYNTQRIVALEAVVASIQQRDATLYRIEQHLIDMDRQLAEIKADQRKP